MLNDKNIEIFTSRDKIRDQFVEYARDYLDLESVDFNKTSYLSYLIDVLSATTANLLYYNTSVYKEFFLSKALQKESVLNIATMLGYSPPLATPATCNILVEIPLTFRDVLDDSIRFYGLNSWMKNAEYASKSVFKFYSDNVVFSASKHVEIQYDHVSRNVVVTEFDDYYDKRVPYDITINKQGDRCVRFLMETKQISRDIFNFTTPDLKPYEFYVLPIELPVGSNPANIIVFTYSDVTDPNVTPTTWENFSSLFLIPQSTPGFVYRSYDKGIKLYFGNGVIGKQPVYKHDIVVRLDNTMGAKGNIISGSITRFDRVYVTENGKRRILNMTAINTEPAFGGTDMGSIDQIRYDAIAHASSNKRLVTEYDYSRINSLVSTLPINNTYFVLKRSDIKTNEINVYADLVYLNSIVPTRNEKITITRENEELTKSVLFGEVFDVSGDDYISMFNIHLNFLENTARYYYLMDEYYDSLALTYSIPINVLTDIYSKVRTVPNFCLFKLIKPEVGNPYVDVTMSYQVSKGDVSVEDATVISFLNNLECYLYPAWESYTERDPLAAMTHLYDSTNNTVSYHNFKKSITLTDIPNGQQVYKFVLYGPTNDAMTTIGKLYEGTISVVIQRNLDSFMYSQLDPTEDETQYVLHDVPLLSKAFYDSIDKISFTKAVYHQLLTFDVNNIRMISDFVNVKFADTTGKLTNMDHNKTTKIAIDGIDPEILPDPLVNNTRFAITDVNNLWQHDPGYVARYNSIEDVWTFERLSVNDIVVNNANGYKYIFDGDKLMRPILDIPLVIQLAVWVDRDLGISDNAITEQIKTKLLEMLYTKFGYDSNLYLTEIMSIVSGIRGVKNCRILSPKHDVFFDYDVFEDFTQEQLLDYKPQLVFIDSTSIEIEIR